MKFLQIATFYQNYLSEFYKRNLHFANLSFDQQISEILNDGFGSLHMIAPYMREVGYDSQLVISNCSQSQIQWCGEQGISVDNPQNWLYEITQKQIEIFKPDILYLSDPITFDSRFLKSLSWKPSLILGWRAANIPKETDWSLFDIILSHLSVCRKQALELGARSSEYFIPGFPKLFADILNNEQKQFDVIFSGQYSPLHQTRNAYLKEIAKAPLGLGGEFSIGFFISSQQPEILPAGIAMNNQGERWGLDMYRALKHGRIVINAEIDLAKGEAGNMRLFETTGVGSFLLTEYHDNIRQYFEPGVEIETFRNSKELIEKIYYYLAHPEEREAIAICGQERCFRDYSMKKRVQELDNIIRKHLKSDNKIITQSIISEEDKTNAVSLDKYFKNITFGNNVQVIGIRNVSIGEGSCIADDVWLNICFRDEKIRMNIGKCVLIGRRSTISTAGYLEIGDYTTLAPNVYVSDADHDYKDINIPIMAKGVTMNRCVRIEENCWLGLNSVVSGNLIIGRGSIVGANSVVLKDVPPFSVVVGNPAHIVKMYDPVLREWIITKTEDEQRKVTENRNRVPLPSREDYQIILSKSGFTKLPSIVAGRGESI